MNGWTSKAILILQQEGNQLLCPAGLSKAASSLLLVSKKPPSPPSHPHTWWQSWAPEGKGHIPSTSPDEIPLSKPRVFWALRLRSEAPPGLHHFPLSPAPDPYRPGQGASLGWGLGSVPSTTLLTYTPGWSCQRPRNLISESLLLESHSSLDPQPSCLVPSHCKDLDGWEKFEVDHFPESTCNSIGSSTALHQRSGLRLQGRTGQVGMEWQWTLPAWTGCWLAGLFCGGNKTMVMGIIAVTWFWLFLLTVRDRNQAVQTPPNHAVTILGHWEDELN